MVFCILIILVLWVRIFKFIFWRIIVFEFIEVREGRILGIGVILKIRNFRFEIKMMKFFESVELIIRFYIIIFY